MAASTVSVGDVCIEDVSSGLEPLPIPVRGLTHVQLIDLLDLFRTYVTDSVLPDGTPITEASPPDANNNDHEPWECGCEADDDGWGCTVIDGDSCDCVAQFGNFYSVPADRGDFPLLSLTALPAKLPLVECSPCCPCARRCANRVTQLGVRIQATVQPASSGIGLGLFTSSSLHTGTFVSLYAGEILTTLQARSRWAEDRYQPGQGNYTLSLRLPSGSLHIDPRHVGNVGRFLNHSCEPSCVIHVVRWGGGAGWSRAAIFTKRAVKAGEELTFDYANASGEYVKRVGEEHTDEQEGSVKRTRCLCGASKCRGWMPYDETL